MQVRVLRPDGVVTLPDGSTVAHATSTPALRQAVAAPAPRPALLTPPIAPAPATAPVRLSAAPSVVRLPEGVVPLAATPLVESGAATSVGLVPGAGTLVTSTPADLLAGPEAVISDFTIISLDSGTW